jgi:hypothetical protein
VSGKPFFHLNQRIVFFPEVICGTFWGNPNIRTTSRQTATNENDQYQFSKKISENERSALPEYLMQLSTMIFTKIS